MLIETADNIYTKDIKKKGHKYGIFIQKGIVSKNNCANTRIIRHKQTNKQLHACGHSPKKKNQVLTPQN